MKLQQTSGDKQPKDYEDPKTFAEAELRLIELHRDIQLMEAQISDPEIKQRKSNKQYKIWKSKVLRAKAWKTHDYRRIKLWMKINRAELRERLLRLDGITDPANHTQMMIALYGTTNSIIKLLGAEEMIPEGYWRVINQVRSLILEE